MVTVLKWVGGTLLVGLVLIVVIYWPYFVAASEQLHMFTADHFDSEPPDLPQFDSGSPVVLAFSKTNGFRHHDTIPAAQEMLSSISSEEGWQLFATENNRAFDPAYLFQFDLVVLNNSSGTLYTETQQQAIKAFLESGRGVVALHAAGGDPSYTWDWYADTLIRARFVSHPMTKHIQSATLRKEFVDHPTTTHLPAHWSMADEWYNFQKSPRENTTVLVSVDESTYDPEANAMGDDHPITWSHMIGEGRVFYSALGHVPETYHNADYREMIRQAMKWALNVKDHSKTPKDLTEAR